jgi:CDP-archaeol synthase
MCFNQGAPVHYLAIVQVLILLMLANGSPIVAKRIFGDTCARPLDANIEFLDGRPLLGASKTIRGIVVAIVITSAGAPLVGLAPEIGLLVATMAMLGDLVSSFVKRRLGWPASSQAIGLDQIPEALFPLLACRGALSLALLDIIAATAIFFVGEVVLARLLFRLHVRDRPY